MKILLSNQFVWRIIFIFGFFFLGVNFCFAQAVLIVNKLNPIKEMSSADVGSIYRLKKNNWDNGNPIDRVNLPVSDIAREKFSQGIYKLPATQMEKFYFTLALQGKGQPPSVLKNSAEVKDYVKVNPNAVGYIDINDLDDSVKAILVEGRKELQ